MTIENKHLDQVESGVRGRLNCRRTRGLRATRRAHVVVLVGGVVVDHHVQLPTGVGAGDLTKSGRDLPMTRPLLAGDGRVAGERSMTGRFQML